MLVNHTPIPWAGRIDHRSHIHRDFDTTILWEMMDESRRGTRKRIGQFSKKTISWLRRPFYTLCHMVRYERHALNYLGCVHLGYILIFLRQTL
jgi:hypothetical protein